MRSINAMRTTALLVSLAASMHVRAASPVYELTDLGDMGGELAAAFAINNQGQVVGIAEESRRVPIPFLFESGRMSGLGVLAPQEIQGAASAISANGMVAGSSMAIYPPGGYNGHPVLWTPQGGLVDLLPPGSYNSGEAAGVNSAGQVVGVLAGQGGGGFIWSSQAGMRFITLPNPLFPPENTPTAINESGVVCGHQWVTPGSVVAWTYDSATGRIDELPGLGGNTSLAHAINGSGDIVGLSARPNLQQRPVMWKHDGGIVDLGFLAVNFGTGEAQAINDARWIVGADYYNGNGVQPLGWLWVDGSKMALAGLVRDPRQAAHWTLLNPFGINARGDIVGQGIRDGIPGRAFKMTLTSDAPMERRHSGRAYPDVLRARDRSAAAIQK